MARWPSLIAFLVVVVGGGLLIGVTNTPGDWYEGLAKPWFTPPGWLFGPAWTTLYVLIAIAGWRTWHRPANAAALNSWFAQLGFNFVWSPVFFTLHETLLALFVALAMLGSILSFIALSWRPDRVSALLFLPYALWVAFACLLNGAIMVLN